MRGRFSSCTAWSASFYRENRIPQLLSVNESLPAWDFLGGQDGSHPNLEERVDRRRFEEFIQVVPPEINVKSSKGDDHEEIKRKYRRA
jgi:hypothetical protein